MIHLAINGVFLTGITIAVVLLIIIMIVVISYRDKKENEEEIDEILSDLRKERKKEEVVKELENVIDKQMEVENTTEKVETVTKDNTDSKTEIEQLLEKMQEDITGNPKDAVSNFEEEQEEKAIISYQELVNSIKGDVGEEPVKEEIIEKIENINKSSEKSNIEKEESKIDKKFKNTDFISPVYGKMKEHLEYPTVPSFEKEEQINFEFDDEIVPETGDIDSYLEELDLTNNMEIDSLEKTLDMPPISNEIKKNDDFLNALKEFRKNLE